MEIHARYHDGSEELFDESGGPERVPQSAGNPKYAEVKQRLAQAMPVHSAAPVPERPAYDFDYPTYSYKLKK